MQRNFFRFLPLLAQLLLPPCPAPAQDAGRSVELYTLFIGRGFKTDYQGLCPSQGEIFPRNVLVSIPSGSSSSKPAGDAAGGRAQNRLEQVFLVFPQEDLQGGEEQLLAFAEGIEKGGLPFTVQLVLAANEGSRRLPSPEGFEHPKGIPVLAESLDSSANSCAIVVRNGPRSRISSGAGGVVAPLWLVKSLKEACQEEGLPVWLPNSASFLYRLGFIDEDESLAPFLDDSIPAAGLELNGGGGCYGALLSTLRKLRETNTESWDNHYSYVSVLALEFWLDESFFLLCYIAAAIAVLLKMCFSTVGPSDRNRAVLKDLSRTWYLILVLLAFTAGILQLSQAIPGIRSPFAAVTLGQKLAVVLAASLILFILLSRLKILVSFESASRIMLFMAACNIFVFCALDISFLFLFLAEYLACLIARQAKGRLAIIAGILLMFLPFIPHAVNILLSSNPRFLARVSSAGPVGNLITALILLPFQLQFLRLLMQMEFFARRKRSIALIRTASAVVFVTASVVAFTFFYFLVVRTLVYANMPQSPADSPAPPRPARAAFEEETDQDYIYTSYRTDSFMEYKFTNLIVSPAPGTRVFRYDISLETESGIPLNDCNYGYSLSGRHKAFIAIPDNPSDRLDIAFTCGKEVTPLALITCYLQDEAGRLLIERDSLNMTAWGEE